VDDDDFPGIEISIARGVEEIVHGSNCAKVVACRRNPGRSQAHNLGTPTEYLTAQRKIVAQRDFVAHHTKCVAQHHFVAKPSFVA